MAAPSSARSIASYAVPASQNTAPIIEYSCIYTRDIRKKNKKWQDGLLRYHTFNRKVMIYDDYGNFVGDHHWPVEIEADDFVGEEFQADRGFVLVAVQEKKLETKIDLKEVIKQRTPAPRNATPQRQRLVGRGVGSSGVSSLRDVLGHQQSRPAMQSPAMRSPFEIKNARQAEKENVTPLLPKRTRDDNDEHVPLWKILKTSEPSGRKLGSSSAVAGPVQQPAGKRPAPQNQTRLPVAETVDLTVQRSPESPGPTRKSSPERQRAKQETACQNGWIQRLDASGRPLPPPEKTKKTPSRIPDQVSSRHTAAKRSRNVRNEEISAEVPIGAPETARRKVGPKTKKSTVAVSEPDFGDEPVPCNAGVDSRTQSPTRRNPYAVSASKTASTTIVFDEKIKAASSKPTRPSKSLKLGSKASKKRLMCLDLDDVVEERTVKRARVDHHSAERAAELQTHTDDAKHGNQSTVPPPEISRASGHASLVRMLTESFAADEDSDLELMAEGNEPAAALSEPSAVIEIADDSDEEPLGLPTRRILHPRRQLHYGAPREPTPESSCHDLPPVSSPPSVDDTEDAEAVQLVPASQPEASPDGFAALDEKYLLQHSRADQLLETPSDARSRYDQPAPDPPPHLANAPNPPVPAVISVFRKPKLPSPRSKPVALAATSDDFGTFKTRKSSPVASASPPRKSPEQAPQLPTSTTTSLKPYRVPLRRSHSETSPTKKPQRKSPLRRTESLNIAAAEQQADVAAAVTSTQGKGPWSAEAWDLFGWCPPAHEERLQWGQYKEGNPPLGNPGYTGRIAGGFRAAL